MKKLKSMNDSHNEKCKSTNDKLISNESKINILSNALIGILTAINSLRDEKYQL